MLEFNWEELQKHTQKDPDKIIDYLANVYVNSGTMYDFLSRKEWAQKIYNSKTAKNNYILNLEGLIKNEHRAISSEQYVYLDLLSRRDKFTYYNTKGSVNFLPIWKVKDVYNVDILKTNR